MSDKTKTGLTVENVPAPGDVRARFENDTAHHEMTVMRDDGLYRHLRFQRRDPKTQKLTGFYWFDLITWPGCLAINGDMDSYLFSRVEDMFEFFRGHKPNPSYWAEKVRAGSRLKEYSEERFRQHVLEHFADTVQYGGGVPKGTGRALREQVLGHPETCYEDGARSVLGDFEHEDFRFRDTWEWDLSDWTYQFLWCCHAVPWGIGVYDRTRTAKAVTA